LYSYLFILVILQIFGKFFIVLGVKLPAVFSSPKLICFEGKMNHILIKVISSIFYYFFSSLRQSHDSRTRYLSR